MNPHVDARIAAIASRQHGLVTSAQLRTVAIDRDAVHRRIARGLLHRVHSRVYAVGHADMPDERRWMAAVLAAGESGALSHTSAARLWGIWRGSERGTHVVADRQVSRRRRAAIEFHSSRRLDASDLTIRHGIPVTSVSRTIVDLATMLTPHQLANVMHEAEYRCLFNLADVKMVIDRLHGRQAMSKVGVAVSANRGGSAGTRSALEDRFLARTYGDPVRPPEVNTRVNAGNREFEVDFLWPRDRVIVEIDGPGHDRPRTRATDAERDRLLHANGYKVIRITADEIRSGAAQKVALLKELLSG